MTANFSDRFSLYWTHSWEVPFYLASRSMLKILPLIICSKISIDFFDRKKEGNFPWQDLNCWPQRPQYGDPPDLSLVHFCCIGAEVWGIPVWGPVGSTFNLLTFLTLIRIQKPARKSRMVNQNSVHPSTERTSTDLDQPTDVHPTDPLRMAWTDLQTVPATKFNQRSSASTTTTTSPTQFIRSWRVAWRTSTRSIPSSTSA